jgi:hypothetical protein
MRAVCLRATQELESAEQTYSDGQPASSLVWVDFDGILPCHQLTG